MNGNLTFRLFQPQDIAGILQLWNNGANWGKFTEKQFYDWYIETPYGECLIVVAVNEEKRIVGQEVFTPSRIYVGGQEKKAVRLSAPILAGELRENVISGAHPAMEMFKTGVTAAVESGYSVIYAFPALNWLPFVRHVAPRVGLNAGEFSSIQLPCCALSLESFSGGDNKTDTNTEVSLVSEFGDDYDVLWQSAKKDFPIDCAIARSSNWLRWKLGNYKVLDVRRFDGGELIGYAAIKEADGLLVDVLARTARDLEVTVTAVIKSIIERDDLKIQLNVKEIKIVKTAALSPVIEKLGFEPIDFNFAFCCFSPDNSVPVEALKPSEWYLMPND